MRLQTVDGSVIQTFDDGEGLLQGSWDIGIAMSPPQPRSRGFRIGKSMITCKPSFEQDLVCDCGNLWPYCTCGTVHRMIPQTDRSFASLNGHMVRL